MKLAAAIALLAMVSAFFGQAYARTPDDLRREIAAKRAEIAVLERQLLEMERAPVSVRAVATQPGPEPRPVNGTAPQVDDTDDIDRALERTLVREGALVLPAFTYELAPYFSWAHWDSVQNPAVSNSYGAGLTFRMGLPWRSQFSATLPHVVDELRRGGTSSGLADAGFLLSTELLQEGGGWPTLLGSVGWTSPTSTSCCSGAIPFVSGFQAGVTVAKRFDPMVGFASVSYFSALSRRIAGTIEDPTDIVGTRLGASLAVTPAVSLTGAMNLAFLTDPGPRDLPVRNSDSVVSSIDVSVNTIVWPRTLLSLTGQVGLTGNVPDFRLITSLPVRF